MRSTATALFAAAFLAGAALPALAVGGDSSEPPKPTETTKKCKKGEVWDKKKKKCVTAKKESMLDDETIYEAARELAYAKRYGEALTVLQLAANQADPRILNYYGFVNRKLGDFETGMRYYKAAIERDPDYILARSYMGQGLMQTGDKQGALVQLAEIEKRGGYGTWAYEALEHMIYDGKESY